MTVGAQSNQVIVFVSFAGSPRDNVVDVDIDVSASRDGAAMTCLNQHAPTEFRRYASVFGIIRYVTSPAFS